jgi:hypothetical protein
MDSILTNAFPRIQIDRPCALNSQSLDAFRNAALMKSMPRPMRVADTR